MLLDAAEIFLFKAGSCGPIPTILYSLENEGFNYAENIQDKADQKRLDC